MMSTAIIDNVASIPDASYTDVNKTDLHRSEIDYLLEALTILDIETDGADTLGAGDIYFDELDQIVALGSGEALGYSPIIVHIISEPLTVGFSKVGTDSFEYGIPSTARQASNDDSRFLVTFRVETIRQPQRSKTPSPVLIRRRSMMSC